MSNKIILTGELALKFGSEIPFHGNNVRDALRCIAANRPGFHKYLIDCEECGIGFHIETEQQDIESPYDCILPIVRGDIIITPIPAGSKSGGAKILTAALIAAVLFIPTGGTSLYGALQANAGTGFLANVAYAGAQAALALSVNLAITGIQQLMAPDPAVDEQDEGYLFNGSEQNIVEGLPVPLLYGELRVPGYPVSFETVSRDRVIESTEATPTNEGYITTDKSDLSQEQILRGRVGRVDYSDDGSSNSLSSFSNDQTAVFTDIISEGPIYGLVDGGNSIYFNDDAMQTDAQSAIRLSSTGVNFSFTNGSSTVGIDKNNYDKNIVLDPEGVKYLVVRNYDSETATAVISTETGTSKEVKITADNAFFADSALYDANNREAVAIIRLVDSNSETVFEGYLTSRDSTTVGYCTPIIANSLNPALNSGGSYTVVLDGKLQISTISGNQTSLTLSSSFPGATGTYKCDITSSNYSNFSLQDSINISSKYQGSSFQFRNGTISQPPFQNVDGTGVGTQAIGPGSSFSPTSFVKTADTGDVDVPTLTFVGTSANGFGLSTAQVQEVDEVRLFISYPQIWNRNESGGQTPSTVLYSHSLRVYRNGAWSDSISLGQIKHYELSNAPIVREVIVNLPESPPFEDFEVSITRITNSDQAYNFNDLVVNPNYTTSSASSVSSLSSIIKENLAYPLTAMAKVRVNASEFSSIPRRTYHCKGLKVRVPSNYITRDENDGVAALYNRNVSTGAIESSYQDWDGNFRVEKVYTNNPAWIFYDILTNDRYGLGGWIEETEIDKYSLYRIARYCDELVANGDGGQEPRFTTNVYLTRETDAYKILKDLASSFRSMLYWMDGEIYPVIDQESDPIYNFSKGNVIDGLFSYESSGSKTRANQVIVSWNNPEANYKLQTVLLEDRDNIVKTGKIIREQAAAFGCTSEAQAIRYGRWKLWTSVNQTEIVSFKTSINANFLAPGNIINVQDADRHPASVVYSGRISNLGTLTETETETIIPLDRSIELVEGSTYELSVLIEQPGTFLAQETATINGVNYYSGDLILQDSGGNPIADEDSATNLVDDSGDYVQVSWREYTRVETQPVSTDFGVGISSLTVSPAFSQVPNAETVWALREILDGVDVQGSVKAYKILAISEEELNIYAITAVEHYNEKYASIEADTFSLQVQDPVFPTPKSDDDIPPPRNVYTFSSDLDSSGVANDVTLFWDPPVSSSNASSLYQFVDAYQLEHNVAGVENPLIVSKNTTSLSAKDFPPGTYTIGVRTISRGLRSNIVRTTFVIEDPALQSVPRGYGIPLGGVISSPIFISADGTFYIESESYTFSPIGNPQLEKTFDGSPIAERTQDCSDIPPVDFSSFTTDFEIQLASHYIMFDASSSDPLTLIKVHIDEDLGYAYAFDAGTGNTTYTSNWTALTGTLSVDAFSNTVTGSGTSFLSQLQIGDIVKFSSTQAAKVAYIPSDTSIKIDKVFDTDISSVSASRSSFRFDKNNDAVFASIRNDNGTFKYFPVNLSVNENLDTSVRFATLESSPLFISFDSDETLTTTYSNLVLTATAVGYANPEFKITGTGFNNSDISQSAESTFSDPTSGNTYVLTLDKVSNYTATDLEFTVTVRDKLDPNNSSKERTFDLVIPITKEGSAGSIGKLVRLTSDDYSIVYDSAGNPSPSGTITFTAAAVNFIDPYFKFTGDGITDETSYTDGSAGDSDTFSFTVPADTGSWASNPLNIRVGVSEASDPTVEVAFDTISIFYVENGADGDDGIDGYTVVNTNSAHTFTANTAGTVLSYIGSGTSIEVYKGGVQLDSVTGTPAAGEFSVSVTATNITPGTPSVAGLDYSIGDHTNMSADTASIEYTLNIENLVTGTQKQTFSKSKQGTAGADGADGGDGADAVRTAEGYVYYNTATSSAPLGPNDGSVTYTWSTGVITGMRSGWQQSPPEMGAGSSGQYYYARYRVVQAFAGDLTSTTASGELQFDSVSLGHNFEGLVTFSSGDFKQDGSTITAIDGGNIETGTISLSKLQASSTVITTGRVFELGTGTQFQGLDVVGKFRGTTTNMSGIVGESNNAVGVGGAAYGSSGSGGYFVHATDSTFGDLNTYAIAAQQTFAGRFVNENTGGVVELCNASNAIQATGNVSVTGTISATLNITAYSDDRLKDRLEFLDEASALSKINSLDVFYFAPNSLCKELKLDGRELDIGISAQQAKELNLEVTNKIPETDYDSVDYSKLTPYLIGAVKELTKENLKLKSDIFELKNIVDSLVGKLDGSSN